MFIEAPKVKATGCHTGFGFFKETEIGPPDRTRKASLGAKGGSGEMEYRSTMRGFNTLAGQHQKPDATPRSRAVTSVGKVVGGRSTGGRGLRSLLVSTLQEHSSVCKIQHLSQARSNASGLRGGVCATPLGP